MFVLAAAKHWFAAALPNLVSSFIADAISREDPGRVAYPFLEESGKWLHCNCLSGSPLSVAPFVQYYGVASGACGDRTRVLR